jgi:cobalt-zinc-cadmium efflux system membrane fusion protein
MAGQALRTFLRHLKKSVDAGSAGGLSDAQLLARFVAERDEAAFELLVWRHAALVWQAARRLLGRPEDVEDVFQATFLTLARQASAVRRPGALAAWLYRVAYRAALRTRVAARRSPAGNSVAELPAPETADEAARRELRPLLDEEINRLPEKYRVPVVLCYLEGRTLEEAARLLGCPRGTVSSRLAGARERLRGRLTRRGLAPSATLPALLAPAKAGTAGVPAALVRRTAEAGVLFGSGQAAGGAVTPAAAALAKGVLRTMWLTKVRVVAVVALGLVAAGAAAGVLSGRTRAEKPDPAPAPVLIPGTPSALRLPPDVLPRLGLQAAEVKPREPLPPRTLELAGSLALDPDRLVRIHSSFAGEFVAMLRLGRDGGPFRVGDTVKQGEILGIVWSKELGEKKGELLDALVREHADRLDLERLEKLSNEGAVPEAAVRQAQRVYEGDRAAVTRAERTLAVWRVPDKEIKAVKVEADRVIERKGKHDTDTERRWAEVEIRAPLDGTLLEKKVNRGDIVDTNTALYTVANLDRLLVVASAAETDLAALRALPAERRRWTVRVAADPDAEPLHGWFDEIGTAVDPNTGTAPLKGPVENPGGRLRPGQFVRVTIEVPRASRELAVPASALVQEGKDSLVFVQPDPRKLEYVRRRVLVVRCGRDVVHVRSPLTPEEERQGSEALRPGEQIVTAGAVELQALWSDVQARDRR